MITFVMLTWNRKIFLEKFFEAFYKNKSQNNDYQFLLVDNGSNDGTVKILKKREQEDKNLKIFYNKKNKGLNQYKRLLNKSKGDYIIILDDDVIDFPENFDLQMVNYIDNFQNFGFIGLDVIVNKHTNGGKPQPENYIDYEHNNLTISEGPTGGWCVIMRRKDYAKIKLRFNISRFNMQKAEDGKLSRLLASRLNLRSGIMKNVCCLHACGPVYSKMFGCMELDLQKFKAANLDVFVEWYNSENNNQKINSEN